MTLVKSSLRPESENYRKASITKYYHQPKAAKHRDGQSLGYKNDQGKIIVFLKWRKTVQFKLIWKRNDIYSLNRQKEYRFDDSSGGESNFGKLSSSFCVKNQLAIESKKTVHIS